MTVTTTQSPKAQSEATRQRASAPSSTHQASNKARNAVISALATAAVMAVGSVIAGSIFGFTWPVVTIGAGCAVGTAGGAIILALAATELYEAFSS